MVSTNIIRTKALSWHSPTASNSPTVKSVHYLFSLTGVKMAKKTVFNRHPSLIGKWSPSGVGIVINLLQGEWWGSIIYPLCYVRDVEKNLATNKFVGALQSVPSLDLKVFGVNEILKELRRIITSIEKQNVAARHPLVNRLCLEKVSV